MGTSEKLTGKKKKNDASIDELSELLLTIRQHPRDKSLPHAEQLSTSAQEHADRFLGELRATLFETETYRHVNELMRDQQVDILLHQCFEHWRKMEQDAYMSKPLLIRQAQKAISPPFFGEREYPEPYEMSAFIDPIQTIDRLYTRDTLQEQFGEELERLDAHQETKMIESTLRRYLLADNPQVDRTSVKGITFKNKANQTCHVSVEMYTGLPTFKNGKQLPEGVSYMIKYKRFQDPHGILLQGKTLDEVKYKLLEHLNTEGFDFTFPDSEEDAPKKGLSLFKRLRRN